MRRFTDVGVCKRERVCARCRDLEGGRDWRRAIAKRYETDGVDWPCPRGHDWNSIGLGDTVAWAIKKVTGGRVKPCGGCRKRQARLNALVPYRR